tara:strand:- start:585 stop:1406 length:822 start_codon:yes stop_codon:yes gene_type:complete
LVKIINSKKKFLIAEVGINHNGKLNEAVKLIDAAKKAGADAVKFQTYITEKRVNSNSPIFNILKKCELQYEDFYKLKKYCDKKNIIFFSTPFDVGSVNFLNKINVKIFKVASFDISNYEIINEIIKTKKEVILSTGMASLKEIYKVHRKLKNRKISHALLHCISNYPNEDKNSYLSNIVYLQNILKCPVGYSDHTNGIKTAFISHILGANIIEKHFKLGKNHNCVDAKVSITPKQFSELVENIYNYKKIMGKVKFGIRPEERSTKIYKRIKIK